MKPFPQFCLVVFLFLLMACQTSTKPKVITVNTSEKVSPPNPELVSADYAKMTIEGMTCAIGCAATIEKKLNQTAGVVSATVDFESETAWVVYDSNSMNLDGLTGVVKSVSDAYSVSSASKTDRNFK